MGKDVNLAMLLLPLHERQTASTVNGNIQIGDDTFTLKAKRDSRLNMNLSIGDFVKAFTIYKNVVVEANPGRRAELDAYLSNMVRMSSQFPGFIYYHYHREFSARAADLWINHRIAIDWSEIDPRIASRHTAGCKANACSLCQSHDHSTDFCANLADRRPTYAARQQTTFKQQGATHSAASSSGVSSFRGSSNASSNGGGADSSSSSNTSSLHSNAAGICWRFNNSQGCKFGPADCRFVHKCFICKDQSHGRFQCKQKQD